ncbi:MAG: hypothetical protein ACRDWE_00235 [Acidimicrobiales bacterium]
MLASEVAFEAVFAVFVLAFLVLAVITIRWAVGRDRKGRAEWARRRAPVQDVRTGLPAPHTNGHVDGPGNGRRPPRRPPKKRPDGGGRAR